MHLPLRLGVRCSPSLCFFSGLILASIGVLGFYLGRVFVEVKARPVIVKAVHEVLRGPLGCDWDDAPVGRLRRAPAGHAMTERRVVA